jgi:hypothetical protein
MKLLLSLVAVFALLQTAVAFWTVVETPIKRYGEFWADLSYFEFNGNSSVIKCRVGNNAYQDETSIIYSNNPSVFIGCVGTPMVGLQGGNRVLRSLKVQKSNEVLNCILLEKKSNYKQYVCGDAIPAADTTFTTTAAVSSSIVIPTVTGSSATTVVTPTSTHTTTKTTTTTSSSSKPTSSNCLSGYRGKRNGRGPNDACCSHSDDCLDTCVSGVCGISP